MSIIDRYKREVESAIDMSLCQAVLSNDAFFSVAEKLRDDNSELSKSILKLVQGFNSCFRSIVDSIESGKCDSNKISEYLVYSDILVFARLSLAVSLIEEEYEGISSNERICKVNDVIAHCLLRDLYMNKLD